MSGRLEEIAGALAGRLGVPPGDLTDGHVRWDLYRRSSGDPAATADLFDAVAEEPDESVALGVVLRLLGTRPTAERPAWVARLRAEHGREYAARRMADLAIVQSGEVTALLADESVQDGWSDWLQLGLAESSVEAAVLARLAEKGRTKRIRRIASERHGRESAQR